MTSYAIEVEANGEKALYWCGWTFEAAERRAEQFGERVVGLQRMEMCVGKHYHFWRLIGTEGTMTIRVLSPHDDRYRCETIDQVAAILKAEKLAREEPPIRRDDTESATRPYPVESDRP